MKNKDLNKCYKNEKELDITVVQIFNKEITEDKNFLIPDLDYKNGYEHYKDKTVFIGGYPYNQNNQKKLEESDFSRGIICDLQENYLFGHKCSTFSGSSGSPLINENKKLVGIHKAGYIFEDKKIGILNRNIYRPYY